MPSLLRRVLAATRLIGPAFHTQDLGQGPPE